MIFLMLHMNVVITEHTYRVTQGYEFQPKYRDSVDHPNYHGGSRRNGNGETKDLIEFRVMDDQYLIQLLALACVCYGLGRTSEEGKRTFLLNYTTRNRYTSNPVYLTHMEYVEINNALDDVLNTIRSRQSSV